MDFSKPHILRSEDEYGLAIAEIEQLLDLDPQAGSDEYDRLEFLTVLAEAFESRDPIGGKQLTPQDLVLFMLDQKGLGKAELPAWMGGKSRTSEFFAGIRPLSMKQIQALRENLGIPADLLI
jgi:HTH-type transcriptional regulator/antitoxin HigA